MLRRSAPLRTVKVPELNLFYSKAGWTEKLFRREAQDTLVSLTVHIKGETDRAGWDAAFECEGQTYSEMDKDYKNSISHRGRALDKLKRWLSGATEGD